MNLVEITIKANDEASDTLAKSESSMDSLKTSALGLGAAVAGSTGASVVGALGIAALSVGAFAAVAGPSFSKIQQVATMTGLAGEQSFQTWGPAQEAAAESLGKLESGFKNLQNSMAPVVDGVIALGTQTASDLLPALGKMATAGASVISSFLQPFDQYIKSASFSQLTSQMAALAEKAGSVLGPALVQLIQQFLQLFVQVAPQGIQILQVLIPAITQLVQAMAPGIQVISQLVVAILDWLNNLHLLVPALIATAAVVALLMGASGILGISLAIVAVTAVVGEFAQHWQQIWDGIKQVVSDFVGWLNQTGNDIDAPFITAFDAIQKAGADIFGEIEQVVKDAVSNIEQGWNDLVDILEAPFKAAYQVISTIISSISSLISSISSGLSSIGSAIGLASGGVVGAAVGGVQGGLRLVGEQGPELVQLPTGSTVYPYSNTAGMMGSGGTTTVNLEFSGGQSQFDSFMLQWMRNTVRVQGGGSVQSAFGRT